MYMQLYIHMHVHIHSRIHILIHIRVHIHIHTHIRMHIHVHLHVMCMYIYTNRDRRMQMHRRIYHNVHSRMHVYIHLPCVSVGSKCFALTVMHLNYTNTLLGRLLLLFRCVKSCLRRCSALPAGLSEVLALDHGSLHTAGRVWGTLQAGVPPGQHALHFGQMTVGLSANAPTGGP